MARGILGREEFLREHRESVWRRVWSAKVAPKVKLFMWRLIQGIIPTKDRLQERGILTNVHCAMCGEQRESTKHVFFF